ncbi:hypothetical protein DFH09DRAFT_1317850 [Mycena vulgaris]|nr:hypothetical protein DFH09DRAFT_1317850 [Mycena vulgaris]
MDHALCPFDFSGLRVLSISTYTEVLRWPQITPALRTVEALDFIIPPSDPMIDLSPFLGFVFLRISINWDYAWPKVLNTLSTNASSNPIRKIVICGVSADEITAEELDSRLSSLLMHRSPVFHFEMDPDEYDRLAPTLHRLSSTNMLRRAERHDDDWFQLKSRMCVNYQYIVTHSLSFNLVLKNPHIDLSLTRVSKIYNMQSKSLEW